jgi:hypothetical protein
MLRRKKSPPPLPIALYSFSFNFVKQHLPTWVGPTAHDTVNEGHCAAIIMEGLIGVPADEMNDILKSALETANEIYAGTVASIAKLPTEDRLQASITIARLICNILYMKKTEKRNFFRRKTGES